MAERPFADRTEAGDRLAEALLDLGLDLGGAIVLGVPRGGVPVAARVARRLALPLDIVVARKLGAPRRSELAIGAIAEGGGRSLDDGLVRRLRVSPSRLATIEATERLEVERRATAYRSGPPPVLSGRTVVLVDDGIATGATVLAACRSIRDRGAARIVVGVPVAPVGWERTFAGAADEAVAVLAPDAFTAISRWYRAFPQTTDDEVRAALVPPSTW